MLDTPVPETPQLGVAAGGAGHAQRAWLSADRILLLALLGLLLPLQLAPGLAWARPLLIIGTGALLVARAGVAGKAGASLPVPLRRIAPAALPFALALAWTFAQAVPWMPTAWQHPVWDLAGEALDRALHGRISLDPAATLATALWLLAHAALFWTALELGRSSRQARIALAGMTATGVLIAGIALVGSMIGRQPEAVGGELTSGAGACALAVLAALAFALDRIVDAAEPGMRARRAVRLAAKAMTVRAGLLIVGLVIPAIAVGILGNGSLVLATLAAILVLVPAILVAPGLRFGGHRLVLIAGVGLMAAAVGAAAIVSWTIGAPGIERSGGTASAAAVRAAQRDAAALGTGLGTYDAAIKPYRDVEEGSARAAAPSRYSRLMVEVGMPATAGFGVGGVALVMILGWGLRTRRRNAVFPALGLAGTVLVAGAATAPDRLSPALTAGYAVLLGIGCAQSFKTRRG
jgi:hypothetical protein